MLGIVILLVGLCCSALFSGSETGFYRATRARWVLDGKAGDRFARVLLWWANNPAVFVSNILIGNNLANYFITLGGVLAVQALLTDDSESLELISAIVLTPIVFVYGESLPKQLFLKAPNRLLRRVVPFLVIVNILLLPAVLVLWCLGRVLEAVIGKSPERVQSRLARQELINMFREGHTAGLLEPVQLSLAQNFFDMVEKTLDSLIIPMTRVVSIKHGSSATDAIELARRHQLASLPVADKNGQLLGYVLVGELLLMPTNSQVTSQHSFAKIHVSSTLAKSLIEMRSADAELALVVDDQQLVRGLLSIQRLHEQLFAGALARWRK
jgi:putative hemolysin